MWYYLADTEDKALTEAALHYGEKMMTVSTLPKAAELVFIKKDNICNRDANGICIAIDRKEPIETAGWTYAVQEPFDREQLIRIAKTLCGRSVGREPITLTASCLAALAVPAHLLGYRYLLRVVTLIREQVHPLQCAIMQDIYPKVAEEYGSTPMMVNRAIRHAIDSAWKHGDAAVQRSYFGYSVIDKKGIPTNVEFIFAVYERTRLLRGEGLLCGVV